MAQWQMKYVRPQDIVVKEQVRKEFDPKKQEELNASVKAHGILQPLLVTVLMVLLAGHRRLIAALAAGLEMVPVIITDRVLSDSEIRVIQLTENMHRASLKPIEQVEGVEEVARLNPEMTNKDLAKVLGFEASMITRLRSVAKVTPAVREAWAVEAGRRRRPRTRLEKPPRFTACCLPGCRSPSQARACRWGRLSTHWLTRLRK